MRSQIIVLAVVAGVLVAYLALVVPWRRLLRRWRLAGPLARARSTGHEGLDAHMARSAWGITAVALVIVAVSVAAWVVPGDRLLLLLAKDNEGIRRGEVWRLLTVALLHSNLVHLAFNVAILVHVGGTFERLAGTARMLLVLVLGTAAGAALGFALMPLPSVGASGGVLALAAALVTFGVRNRAELPRAARWKLFGAAAELVGLNMVLTFVVPKVDWAAHVGGLLAGALLGWLSPPSAETRRALAVASPGGPVAAPADPAAR